MNTTVLRFSNVYGLYSYHKTSVIHLFIKQILQDEQLTIYGDGEQTRDFVYSKDIAQAVELALIDESEGFDLYQVGTGNETSVNELFGLIKEKMKQRGYQSKIRVTRRNDQARSRGTIQIYQRLKMNWAFLHHLI